MLIPLARELNAFHPKSHPVPTAVNASLALQGNQMEKENMVYITKAKAVENTPVRVAVYDAPLGTPYSDIARYPIANKQAKEASKSILSQLDDGPNLADVQGWKVTMVAKLGENEFEDTVEIVGEKNRAYHVRINGEVYSVLKSVVRFILKTEVME